MSWVKNTGSPSTSHPFSSLNPDAVAFVPRQGNTAPAEESPRPVVPRPFSNPERTVEDASAYYEDKTVVANDFSENTTNVYQDYHAHKPQENSTNQNNVENCQTVEADEIADADEHIPSPLEEEQRHHSSEAYSDQNFQNRDKFRGRGRSGYSNRRGGRGSFRGKGKYFNDNQHHHSESRWHGANNVYQSSDKPQMNEESSPWENSSRIKWGTQGPRQHDQDWREKRSRNNSRDTRETVDNRDRRRGTNPRSRGGNQWRGPKVDKSHGGRQDRKNANSSEDELRMSHDDSSWDNYHIADDDSSNAWDQDEKQDNVALTKPENIEDSNSLDDVVVANTSEIQNDKSLTSSNTDDTKEDFKLSNFNNKFRTRPYYDKTNQKRDRFLSDSRRSFDEDDTKDLPEGRRSTDFRSQAEEKSSNGQYGKWERRQGSSRTRGIGRGRSNFGPRLDEQKSRENRNRGDEPYRNNERQNRQRENDSNSPQEQRQTMDGRIGRRGTYSQSGGSNQRRGKYDGPEYDYSRYPKYSQQQGRQDRISPGKNNHKDSNYPEDDLKITNDESSSDNYHITDDDSNNADKEQNRQADLSPSESSEHNNSWNAEVESERSQSTSVTNTLEKQENNYTLANDDTKETLRKSSESNNKSGRSSQRPNKSVSKSRRPLDEGDDTDLPEGTNLMDMLLFRERSRRAKISSEPESKNSTKKPDDREKPKKQSEKPSESISHDNREDSVPSSAKFTKAFPEEKNNNVAERVKSSRQITETQKFLDPRMEREKLSKSCDAVVLEEERERKKNSHLEGNNKQRRITSYFKPGDHRELWDKEFDLWEKRWETIKEFKIVHEVEGDLFEQPKEYSLAHCVAEDLRMGSGIAVAFKREFKNLPDLLDQKAKQGGLATLHDEENNRYVYYLVTKRESTGKPTYLTLWKSLWKMREHVKENEVKKIAVPRLACGLDRLEWVKVKSMLESVFQNVEVEIRVCNFQQNEFTEEKKSKTCKLVVQEIPVTKIETGTLILYLATSDGKQDDIIVNLSKKFDFWPSFQASESKDLGNIVYYDDKVKNFGLCGCIVRRTSKDTISFKSLHTCIQNFNKKNKQFGNDKFEYVAFQWVDENAYYDDLINQKIITLLIGFLRDVEVYVCKGSFGDEGE